MWTAAMQCSYLPILLLVLVLPISKGDYVRATVNATVLDSKGNPTQTVTKDDGLYGYNSPKVEAKGIAIAPAPNYGVVERQGCDPHTRLLRGNCTFKKKIFNALAFNAPVVLVHNNSSKETMTENVCVTLTWHLRSMNESYDC
uniref:Uncharacterized protein n=1 Tax=Salmo trutta TaxID=8032 RepID=A0A674CSC4_SALTR